MNFRLTVLLLGLPGVVLASDPERTPEPRPRLTQELRSRVEAVHAGKQRLSTAQATGVPTEAKDQITVVGGDHGMIGRPNGPSPASRPFDLEGGGTYWSNRGAFFTSETMLQYDAPNAGWDLLRITF